MAHMVETMAFANEVPWHGLGTRVDGDVTVEEMVVAAGLDWDLELLPLSATTEDGETIEVPGRYALTRNTDRKVFTLTGPNWKPLQPRDVVGFMRDYVEAGGATLETAGSLREGRIIWGLAKLDASYEASKGDKVEGYLLIISPNEVGKSIQIRGTGVRVVCANTMALAMGQSDLHYRQGHLREFDVNEAKRNVEEAIEALGNQGKVARQLHKMKLTLEDSVKMVIVPTFMPSMAEDEEIMKGIMDEGNQPKVLRELINSIQTAPGAEPGTGWGTLNGVTHWADHVAGREQEARLYRSWMGDNMGRKAKVQEKLLELAA